MTKLLKKLKTYKRNLFKISRSRKISKRILYTMQTYSLRMRHIPTKSIKFHRMNKICRKIKSPVIKKILSIEVKVKMKLKLILDWNFNISQQSLKGRKQRKIKKTVN